MEQKQGREGAGTFPLRHWLRERAAVLHYTRTYVNCLVFKSVARDAVFRTVTWI